ncbi:hypothetical protein A2774_00245 [Candidatus Roizmanbacteria bacterium RIFCSPHIGHO2_01_FULL_39_12c]|uniref:Uncharacterized protein n=1 Tax=Candidatus Roizmanbacteria bacterium RIFCSPHIGHO2_01_FULL_39_12c TaxID=1802031 RepID=A0A1F7GD12_9BACT|nr:MAG: hypothetical protein A2774_00245 [Candidatus Roizmanbacteria bacterium RIFCSPHIGHO2_01_FULL_39_12c]
MAKKLVALMVIILTILFISNRLTTFVQGQGPDEVTAGPSPQLWRCLQAEQVGGRTARPPPEVDLTVTGSGFPALVDIYLIFCSPTASTGGNTPTNYRCTTGNSDFDRLIFGTDLTGTVSPLSFEVPKGVTPPQTIQAIGDKIDTVIHLSHAQGHVNYAFFGVSVNEPQLQPGQGSTIQYGTFQFQQDPTGCTSIRWDPYGRVFDSQSLEPIQGVSVTLLNKDKQFASMPGLRNPEVTERDGAFNFFVDVPDDQPQTFYLRPYALPPLTHAFSDTPNLHPNFTKAYFDIYKPDEPIIEAPGFPEHRDIPLDPGTNPPFTSTPKDMSYSSVRLGSWVRYEGVVSHPLSIVTLAGKLSLKEYARTTADKLGGWTILMPINKVPHSESLKTEIIKVDIASLVKNSPASLLSSLLEKLRSFIAGEVSAQPQDSVGGGAEFDPILTYVEGYARDKNGDVIANATVRVKLEMSDGVYYETKADDNGFFIINPENLPIFAYYLEFSSPDVVSLTKNATSEFVQNNEEHLTANNVNLMAATINGESLIPTESPQDLTQAEQPPPEESEQPFIAGENTNLILTLVAVIVLLGAAGGVLLYIKKKSGAGDIV